MDAVHAVLAYERSGAAANANSTPMQQTPFPVDHAMQTPHPSPRPQSHPHPPSPAYAGSGDRGVGDGVGGGGGGGGGMAAEVREAAVGPTAQTPTPESPMSILAGLGSGAVGVGGSSSVRGDGVPGAPASALPLFPVSPTSPIQGDSGARTPLSGDVTRPELFSTTRLRSGVGGRGRGMGLAGEDDGADVGDGEFAATTELRGGGRGDRSEMYSPPTPTVLFGELAGDGASTTWGAEMPRGGGGGDGYNAGSIGNGGSAAAAAAAMTMRMATTPAKIDGSKISNGGGSRAREDVAASLLSMLRLETSKRKEAEAKTAGLEAALADATAAKAEALAAVASPTRDADGSSKEENAQKQQQQQQQPDPQWFARYARVDRERQEAEIMSLVRDARKKVLMEPSSPPAAGNGSGGRDGKGEFAGQGWRANGGKVGTGVDGGGEASPVLEVASLIRQFDEKLTRSGKDNAQLRVFCSHLEGLLAANDASKGAEAGGAQKREAAALPFVVTTAATGAVRSAVGSCGCPVGKAGGNDGTKHRLGSKLGARYDSLGGDVRRGSAFTGPFQQLC